MKNTSGKNREEDKKQYLPSSSNSNSPFVHIHSHTFTTDKSPLRIYIIISRTQTHTHANSLTLSLTRARMDVAMETFAKKWRTEKQETRESRALVVVQIHTHRQRTRDVIFS